MPVEITTAVSVERTMGTVIPILLIVLIFVWIILRFIVNRKKQFERLLATRESYIVSTYAKKSFKIRELLGGVLVIGFGIFLLVAHAIVRESDEWVAFVGVLFMLLGVYFATRYFFRIRSFCIVCDDGVVGKTYITFKGTSFQQFEVLYSDILNVSASNNKLAIHTAYKTYEVMAFANVDETVKSIKERIK